MLIYKYDKNKFYTKDLQEWEKGKKIPEGWTSVQITKSFYKPKFTGEKWIEGATKKELEDIKKKSIANDLEKNKNSESERIARIEKLEKALIKITDKLQH